MPRPQHQVYLISEVGSSAPQTLYDLELISTASRERAALQLQLISDLCDLTVPSTTLGWTGFDEGIVGLAGTVSSLIGVYGAWRKSA
jgi:hypothetical protein